MDFAPLCSAETFLLKGKLLTQIMKMVFMTTDAGDINCVVLSVWASRWPSRLRPSNPAAELSLEQKIEQVEASTTGKVARQFQESQLHLQLERRPELEGGRVRERGGRDREREREREQGREREASVLSQASALSAFQTGPFRNSKAQDQFQVFLCDCSSVFHQQTDRDCNFCRNRAAVQSEARADLTNTPEWAAGGAAAQLASNAGQACVYSQHPAKQQRGCDMK